EIEEKPMVRSIEARGPSPVGEEFLVNETARSFERVLEAILATAARESRLKRIGEEIYTTTRRVNALEELLIPSLRKRIRNIERSLEEREREEVFRLKRFKMRHGSKTAVKPDPDYFPLKGIQI
ncbi:MAG TPA: V-type ATP synthase subunit D, partial [Thermodesulfobacteriota bacterium]|nr:V-type ATP synthase subunit D [Thermodesulfobacteriota bacterium]